jgi:hypothetical protein
MDNLLEQLLLITERAFDKITFAGFILKDGSLKELHKNYLRHEDYEEYLWCKVMHLPKKNFTENEFGEKTGWVIVSWYKELEQVFVTVKGRRRKITRSQVRMIKELVDANSDSEFIWTVQGENGKDKSGEGFMKFLREVEGRVI